MGNEYSRMQATRFPTGYFCIGFRQPEMLQILHADDQVTQTVKRVIHEHWKGGIKSEKKYVLGLELKLAHEPFSADINRPDIAPLCYKLVNVLLTELLNEGCSLLTASNFIRGVERNIWIFYKNTSGLPTDHKIVSLGMEDWGKLILVNATQDICNALRVEASQLWPQGVTKEQVGNGLSILELGGQPWDSYKSDSEKTPLLLMRIIKMMASFKYSFYTASHIRGNADTLFFVENNQCCNSDSVDLMLLSFNQQDQIRLFGASKEIVDAVGRVVRQHWIKGVNNEELWGEILVMRLKGSPWWGPDWDKDNALTARHLVTQVVHELRAKGWMISGKMDLYRSQYDKSLLILERCEPAVLPHFCMSTYDVDRLCLQGAPHEARVIIQEEVRTHWTRGVKEDPPESKSETTAVDANNSVGAFLEFTLEGRPWHWDIESPLVNLEGIGLFCSLLESLSIKGFELVTAADFSSSSKFAPYTLLFCLRGGEQNRPINILTE